jgi:hypothetical protein
MQRVRMSLPYYKEFGWEPTVLTAHDPLTRMASDPLLLDSIPDDIRIVRARAINPVGPLKGLALRALYPLYKEGLRLLKDEKFDLVFFSTSIFPTPVLGYFWKKKTCVPYIIDLQDPWVTDYYKTKPVSERPPNHWFSSRMHRYTEPLAMRHVSGLISVSQVYFDHLANRYPNIKAVPREVIPFSASRNDINIARLHASNFRYYFDPTDGIRHLLYVGRVGHIMRKSLSQLFRAFKNGLDAQPQLYGQFKMHFLGTDYAPADRAVKSVLPLAVGFRLEDYVTEHTDRLPFFSSIAHLEKAAGLLVPGSDDPGYNASKIYPYLLTGKPILGFFHEKSPVVKIINTLRKDSVSIIGQDIAETERLLGQFLKRVINADQAEENQGKVWDAYEMTREQVTIFNKVEAIN